MFEIFIAFISLLIFTLVIVLVMNHVTTSKKVEDENIQYINGLIDTLKRYAIYVEDESIRNLLNEAVDKLTFSDINSTSQVENLEVEIENQINALGTQLQNENKEDAIKSLEKLIKLIEERKIIIKSSKG
ncbi:MAG TPA: hypothetical protein HA255_04655 [Methanosphaera sp.]|nr:hypothetical protein [Methanosphaera sp.]